MDPSRQKSITISSHNVNGFNHSKNFLYSLCDKFPDAIRAIQEHWLAPPYKKQQGVNRLRALHPDFDGFGNSAMKKDVENKVRLGRGYGGTGFLYNKKFASSIKQLVQYKHERVSVLKLSGNDNNIILINSYLPYYKTNDLANYIALYQDTLSYIENVIVENRTCGFVLLLDMNCNLYNSDHPYSKLLIDLMNKYSLISAFDLIPNFDPSANYTRCNVKTGSFTLIDGMLISKSLRDLISDVRISHYGDNVSDHSPVEMTLRINVEENSIPVKTVNPCVMWDKLTTSSIDQFRTKMSQKLDEIDIPSYLLHGNNCCTDLSHRELIDSHYNSIVNAVLYADSFLPRVTPGTQKSFWSEELNVFKKKSIDCCRFWKANGMPSSGPIFECKKKCSYEYKAAIRSAKKRSSTHTNDLLHDHLVNRDPNSFWKVWRNESKADNSLVTRVDGVTDEKSIADAFGVHFKGVYSGSDTSAHQSLKREFDAKFRDYFTNHVNDYIGPSYFSWADMINVVKRLKMGKSSAGFIKPEHVLNGSESLLIHLHLLFNSMLQHGYVVGDFLEGTITPIIKDTQGDLSDSKNYRPITVGPLFSKMFEIALDEKISPLLNSDELQFGFKQKTSTSHALYVLKSTINRFTMNRSNVYAAFLDCSKAFDRISHYGLFIKLIERKVPLVFLLVIMFWHLGMTCKVKWANSYSDVFPVPLGTKQGGIMSPRFFSIYINDMIVALRKSGIGCHLIDQFVACILFADDLALLAPSRSALQSLIDICHKYCSKFCLEFNAGKSKIMIFGSVNDTLKPLELNAAVIDFVNEWQYLGTTITAGKHFSFTARKDISSFYRAVNSVLNVLDCAHEHTLMNLLYTNCIPILSYAGSVKEYPSTEMTDCNTAINSATRKIFGFTDRLSVRLLRKISGFRSIYEIFASAKAKFEAEALTHHNHVIKFIAALDKVD